MSPVDTDSAPRSAPRVVSAHQASVDSLEAGATTRETTSPRTRSRSAQAGPSSAGRPRFAAIAWTAATCPCVTDRVMVIACPAGTSGVPFSAASIEAIAASGSADKLASVSCFTLPPSRYVRRTRTDSYTRRSPDLATYVRLFRATCIAPPRPAIPGTITCDATQLKHGHVNFVATHNGRDHHLFGTSRPQLLPRATATPG